MTGAILGIAVSLVPILLVQTVSDGMIQGITSRYIELKSYHVQAALPDSYTTEEAAELEEELIAKGYVEFAHEEVNLTAIAVSAKGSHAVLIRAVEPAFFSEPGIQRYLRVPDSKEQSTTDSPALDTISLGSKDIVLGTALASALEVTIGDMVTILAPEKDQKAENRYGYSPRLLFFRVKAIADGGYRDLDSLWAFIDQDSNARLLETDLAYRFMGFKVKNPYSNTLGQAKADISEVMERRYPEWFSMDLVRTWPEIERNLYHSFGTTKSMLIFIMAIALVVAAINLGSALSTYIAEHTEDIAILKSVGASSATIGRLFVGTGLLTGVIGTALGLGAGIAVSIHVNRLITGMESIANLLTIALARARGVIAIPAKLLDPEYYLESIPVVINPISLFIIAAASIMLSVAVSYVPSRKAAGISVQALMRKR